MRHERVRIYGGVMVVVVVVVMAVVVIVVVVMVLALVVAPQRKFPIHLYGKIRTRGCSLNLQFAASNFTRNEYGIST